MGKRLSCTISLSCSGWLACRSILGLTLGFLMLHAPIQAQSDVGREFDFANDLVDYGFYDLGKKVMDKLAAENAREGKPLLELFAAKRLMSTGKFDESEKILKAADQGNVSTLKMRLQLAIAYYSDRKYEPFEGIFDDVLGRFQKIDLSTTSEDEKKFFMDAAYIYYNLMDKRGDLPKALKGVNMIIKTEPDDEILGKLQLDRANIQVSLVEKVKEGGDKKKLAEAEKKARGYLDDVFGRGLDLWFGKGISTLVRLELILGNLDAAFGHVRTYKPDLIAIENMLVDQKAPIGLSPLADLGYVEGEIYFDLFKKGFKEKDKQKLVTGLTKSYNSYLNVFRNYENSDWGPKAALKALDVQEISEKIGLKFDGNRRELLGMSFRLADTLYEEKRYEEAIPKYEEILNKLPEVKGFSAKALANLANCYMESGDYLMPRVIASYLGDRFRSEEEAATAVYRIGTEFLRAKKAKESREVLTVFGTSFTNSVKASGVLYSLAEMDRRDGIDKDIPKALERAFKRYSFIIDNYPDSKEYVKSLAKRGARAVKTGDMDMAKADFLSMVKATPPSEERIRAMLNLANCEIQTDNLDRAKNIYNRINEDFETEEVYLKSENRDWVNKMKETTLYRTGSANAQSAQTYETKRIKLVQAIVPILTSNGVASADAQDAAYNMTPALDGFAAKVPAIAPAVTRMKELKSKTTELQTIADEAWEQYLKKYPKGQDAPRAMNGRGRILLVAGQTKEAVKIFQRLSERYPEAEETQQAYFYLVKTLIDLGRPAEARQFARDMVKTPDQYTARQLFSVGRLMNANKFYSEGGAFLEQVFKHKDTKTDKEMIEHALYEYTVALVEQENYDEAIKRGEMYLSSFPSGGYYFKIQYELARAYLGMKKWNRAHNSLVPIVNQFSTGPRRVKADNLLVDIQMAEAAETGNTKIPVGSFHRMTIRPGPDEYEMGVEESRQLEEIYLKGLKYTLDNEAYKITIDLYEAFTTHLPDSENTTKARAFYTKAKQRLPEEVPSPAVTP